MNSLFLFSSHSDFLLKIPFIRFFGSKTRVKYLLFTDKNYDDGRKVHRAHHWSSSWWIGPMMESCCCWSGTLSSDRSRIFRRGWSWNRSRTAEFGVQGVHEYGGCWHRNTNTACGWHRNHRWSRTAWVWRSATTELIWIRRLASSPGSSFLVREHRSTSLNR